MCTFVLHMFVTEIPCLNYAYASKGGSSYCLLHRRPAGPSPLVFLTFSMSFGFLEAFEVAGSVPKAWARWN